MGEFMDMIRNISDNVWSIPGIFRRQKLEDEFVFKAHRPWIVLQEEVTLRAWS